MRTVRRWAKQGAPLHDPSKMPMWLAGRQTIPAGTAKVLAATRPKPAPSAPELVPAALPPEGELGATAALWRLASAELASYDALQCALESADPDAVKIARKAWLQTSESLRKFDLAVEESRTLTGELIGRDTVKDWLHVLGIMLAVGGRATAQSLTPRLVHLTDENSIFELLDTALARLTCTGVSAAWVEEKFPAWFRQELQSELNYGTEPEKGVRHDRFAETFAVCCRMFCTAKGERTPAAFDAIVAKHDGRLKKRA